MRLIDADALIEIVEDGLRSNPHKDGYARVCHRTEYTHFLDVIQRMPTIAPPPNEPLTLEELREMDGEPVWICDPDGSDGMWALVDLEYELCRTAKGGIAIFDIYGKTWRAYRRR